MCKKILLEDMDDYLIREYLRDYIKEDFSCAEAMEDLKKKYEIDCKSRKKEIESLWLKLIRE